MTIASPPVRLPAIAKPLLAERVVDPLGQRALADDGELGGGGERTADERAEGEDQRRFWRERIARGRPSSSSSQTPRPLPPRNWRSTSSASGTRSALPRR